MQRESGISAVAIVAVLAVLAAGAAGFFAWRTTAELNQLQSELNATRSGLDKARADLKKAAQEMAVVAKEAKESKAMVDRLTTERDAVRVSMENSQANGERMRAELELAKSQISYFSARASKDVVRGMPKVSAR